MVPRLRRLNELNPCIPLLVLLEKVVRPVLPWSAGSCAMASNRLGSATFSISALDSTVVGVGCVNPAEVIREPVTTTASRVSFVASSRPPGCGTSAAPARSGAADRTNKDAHQTLKSRLTIGIIPGPHARPLGGGFSESACSINALLQNRQLKNIISDVFTTSRAD